MLEAQAKQLNDEARHLRSLKQCIQVRQTACVPPRKSQCAAHSELLGGAYDSEVIPCIAQPIQSLDPSQLKRHPQSKPTLTP